VRRLVQLYESDGRPLARNLSQYLLEGLKRGDGLLVVATTERFEAFVTSLKQGGADPDQARRVRRLVFLDAHEALARAEGLTRIKDANDRPSWGVVPKAEPMVLLIRDNLPEPSYEILDRARHYITSHLRLSKELFLKLRPG
jgi:hypothetical protein